MPATKSMATLLTMQNATHIQSRPDFGPRASALLADLRGFVAKHPKLLVLTGAGISAKSGISTYRNPQGDWQHSRPIQHREFLDSTEHRQRYWARSAVGWRTMAEAKPNDAHKALVTLEQRGSVPLLVTQNVDRLHQQAGHSEVIDLHGRLDQVICLSCSKTEPRSDLQHRLITDNPVLANTLAELRPDGDANVDGALARNVRCPSCVYCGGVVMPDVVFFGGTVPKARVNRAMEVLERVDALMVVGSSLMVFSGFRFCKAAQKMAKPIVAINQGVTRADDMLTLKVEHDCTQVLTALL